MTGARLSKAHEQVLAALYEQIPRTVDDLPYTEDFDLLYERFCNQTGVAMSRHDVWRSLAGCRKHSGLARKGRRSRDG